MLLKRIINRLNRWIKDEYSKLMLLILGEKKTEEIKQRKRCKNEYRCLNKELNKYIDFSKQKKTEEKYMVLSGINCWGIGIFCHIQAFIRWLQIAEELEYIPVIDLCNVPNQYLEDGLIGIENAWEYYFEQPVNVNIEKAYLSKNIFVANRWDKPVLENNELQQMWEKIDAEEFLSDINVRNKYKSLYQKYIRLNESTKNYIETIWDSFGFAPETRVLGLLCRGTDYYAIRPYGHDIQPTPEQIVRRAKEIAEKFEIEHYFVATEDQDILDILNEAFPGKVYSVSCCRLHSEPNTYVGELFEKNKVGRKQRGLDYIAAIYLLGKCDYLLAGRTMATDNLFLLKEGEYKFSEVWNLGKYGIDDILE